MQGLQTPATKAHYKIGDAIWYHGCLARVDQAYAADYIRIVLQAKSGEIIYTDVLETEVTHRSENEKLPTNH